MGGKSRKSGGVSKALVEALMKEKRSKIRGKKSEKRKRRLGTEGFGLIKESE